MNLFLGGSYVLILVFNNLNFFAAREEKFLHFPPKTNIVMTMSLLKLFPNETILNTLTEFDVLFPLPSHPFENKRRRSRAADQKLIVSRLKEAAELFGLDGNSCLQQLICQLQKSLPPSSPQEDNLLYDIFDIIFQPEHRISTSECEDRPNMCQIQNWIDF